MQYFLTYTNSMRTEFQMVFLRQYIHYYMTHVPENNKPAILQDFVKQFYAGTPFIPRELMLQYEIEDAELIEKWLSERKGSRVYLKVPKIGGKEKLVERKIFPGYVLVKMILTDESWHLIHNVRGATGFVGSDGKAIPLTEQEIYDLGVEHKEIVVGYALGDEVRVNDGPLAGFNGIVEELEPDKNRVRVVVSMFGRETPVDLELDQVDAIKE
mgnify:CR=1 FL=1